MAIFKVMQINLSDQQVNEVNLASKDGETLPEYYTRRSAATASPSHRTITEAWDLYNTAAYIEAEDLDEVFEIGNIGPEDSISRAGPMHSISVGDVIIDTLLNVAWYVDTFGFESLGHYDDSYTPSPFIPIVWEEAAQYDRV